MSGIPIAKYWFGRFQVVEEGEEFVFRDSLILGSRRLPAAGFAGLGTHERDVAFFVRGFLGACFKPYPAQVADRPQSADDVLFWQFPCRTEAEAYARHAALAAPAVTGGDVHVYVGMPWASFIDTKRMPASVLKTLKVRISGASHALKALGVKLRVHTVCQHVYWERCIPDWAQLGVTDVWLSHAMPGLTARDLPFEVHPWALYAVNVEDPQRQQGLVRGKDPADKPYLASFIGAHADHYLSDVRKRLLAFADEPGFLVRVLDKWHFEDVVYQHQVKQVPLDAAYSIDDSVAEYNRVLSDSVFALCPSGAGPNSLRLWEALAVGAVPVLLGQMSMLPQGGSLPEIDWDAIVLRVPDELLVGLPKFLRELPLDEVSARHRRSMEAYALVRQQRCF